MTIKKEQEFAKLEDERYHLEIDLNEKLVEDKKIEIEKYDADRKGVDAKILAWQEYQKSLEEESNLKKEIELAYVDLEELNIKVKELEDGTEFLTDKKDELTEQKKAADQRNEELKKELIVKEEQTNKRIALKLSRERNDDVKNLIAHKETAEQHVLEL